MRYRHLMLAMLAALLLTPACGGGDDGDAGDDPAAAGGELVGLFRIKGGECPAGGQPTGSFFKMVEPDGALDSGPFIENVDSACDDKKLSPLLPGSDGGLRTGAFQGQADPPFDAGGNGVTSMITQPTKFFGVAFALATNETDPQTESGTKRPAITADGTELSGDMSAMAAAWNNQHFNQGSPKPDGEKPGLTSGPSGTYDPDTGAYTLEWTSQIVGGPFNNFTGVWHFEGTFEPEG